MATVKDFSIEEKLVAVLTLQKIDSKIDDIKTLQGELPMEVRDLEDEIQGLQTRINNIDNEIDIINSVIAERTAGEKEAKAMIKKYEKQQENVKNSREFEAINKGWVIIARKWDNLTDSSGVGYPMKATKEKGEKYLKITRCQISPTTF